MATCGEIAVQTLYNMFFSYKYLVVNSVFFPPLVFRIDSVVSLPILTFTFYQNVVYVPVKRLFIAKGISLISFNVLIKESSQLR